MKGWTVLWAVLATLVVVLLLLNLGAGEKQIDEKLERLYSTGDPQFRRLSRQCWRQPATRFTAATR